MQIHRIRGRDLRDALERAGELHGSDSVVLGHEPAPGGGVTVAVGRQDVSLFAEKPAALPPPSMMSTARLGLDDVERVLRRSGATHGFCQEIVRRVASSGASGAFALDAAAAAIGEVIPIAASPRLARTSYPAGEGATGRAARQWIIAFAGARHAGKTTSLLKLALRLVQARRRVGIATLDVRRPGAVEHLVGLAQPMQVPVETAANGELLVRALGRLGSADVILIDTSGELAWDAGQLQRVQQWVERSDGARGLESYWVHSASSKPASTAPWRGNFEPRGPSAIVLTKLDETNQPGPGLELAWPAGAPGLVFLCDGPEFSAGMRRASANDVADLFLRGRLT